MELRLRVFFESSQSEELAVIDHGDDLYELMETPLLFEASIGEIYKAVRNGDQLIIKELYKESRFVKFSYLLSRNQEDHARLNEIKGNIEFNEGKWEQVFGGIFIVYLPKESEFDIENEMKSLFEGKFSEVVKADNT